MTNEATNNAAPTNDAAAQVADVAPSLINAESEAAPVDPNAKPTDATDANKPADETNVDKPKDGDEGKKADDDTKNVAPEKYEDFVMPEGVEIDPETMTEYTALAKKYNLSQEAAQELASLGAKLAAQSAGVPTDMVKQASAEWQKESVANTEFGGVKLAENLATAKKALDAFGSPGLKELLDVSGLGNHPEVIGYFFRVGKNISEDGMFNGTKTTNAPRAPEDILYGKKN